MKKLILQGILFFSILFSSWFLLSQVNWMTLFKIESLQKTTEESLGEIYWNLLKSSEKEIVNKKVLNPLESLVTKICLSNKINPTKIKLHLIKKDEINAFALPNNHLVIYTGLIENCENENELNGVICHELAHIELSHIMKKLINEVGTSVLISIVTNGNNSEIIRKTSKLLTSSSYDRSLEKEADLKAIQYLEKSLINPTDFSNFLFKLSLNESKSTKYLEWISTHPDSEKRAKYILKNISHKPIKFKTILTQKEWENLKNNVSKLFR